MISRPKVQKIVFLTNFNMNKIFVQGGLSQWLSWLGILLFVAGILIIIFPQLLAYCVAGLLMAGGLTIYGYGARVKHWQQSVNNLFRQ